MHEVTLGCPERSLDGNIGEVVTPAVSCPEANSINIHMNSPGHSLLQSVQGSAQIRENHRSPRSSPCPKTTYCKRLQKQSETPLKPYAKTTGLKIATLNIHGKLTANKKSKYKTLSTVIRQNKTNNNYFKSL